MSNQISNTTSLSFEYGPEKSTHIITDTTATATMSKSINGSVVTLETSYYLNEYITYLININNSGSKTDPLTLRNNLGTYKKSYNDKSNDVTPLSYIEKSYIYINGIFKNQVMPEIKPNEIIFQLPAIGEKSSMLLIYKTKVNHFAPLTLNSEIETITSLDLPNSKNLFETSHTIKVDEKADLKISKNISPQVFSQGEALSYNISICNYGNTLAKNIKITDTFNPSPTLTSITVDKKEISPSDYSYTNGIFHLPAYGSNLEINVPSAKFKTDNNSGATSTEPSVTNITICGII